MLAIPPEFETVIPLFSVIIPLADHRCQWEKSWHGWQAQTLDKSDYEIIFAVPPDFPERDNLIKLAGATSRVELSDQSHDIGLNAEGAARARGKFLFFTESHCWPEPDVLALCLQAFNTNDDLAGFSCRLLSVTPNRLSEAEAAMYSADMEFGLTVHPWRKVVDPCFVTRREAYEECGGLQPELGHFAEWALAASYFERGRKIGFLPEALLHHYYCGSLSDVKEFTLDFVKGEIRYFSRDLREPSDHVLETPPEWICQGNFDPDMSRGLLHVAIRNFLTPCRTRGQWKESAFLVWRWVTPAIFGDGVARFAAATFVLYAFITVTVGAWIASSTVLNAQFKSFVAALIRYQRLSCIRTERQARTGSVARTPEGAVGLDTFTLDGSGFYPLEIYHGTRFRWSETAAAVRLRASAGRQRIRIDYLSVRALSKETGLRFYTDGMPVPYGSISYELDHINIDLDFALPKMFKLGWTCRAFPAADDTRHLGLPIKGIKLIHQGYDFAATDADRSLHKV